MSTFVTIGNGTQSFHRLLEAVREVIDDLPQPVVIQTGRTPFVCDRARCFELR